MSEVFDKELIDKAAEPIPWYIKVALWFVPAKTSYDIEGSVVTVTKCKILKGKIYLIYNYSVDMELVARGIRSFGRSAREVADAMELLGNAWRGANK